MIEWTLIWTPDERNLSSCVHSVAQGLATYNHDANDVVILTVKDPVSGRIPDEADAKFNPVVVVRLSSSERFI